MCIVLNAKRKLNADVVVTGGGTAGVFAAVCAARAGAKTILVEKNSMLGGTVTNGGVNFPGLFFAWGKQIISGPCYEAIKKAESLGGALIPDISFKPKHHFDEQILLNKFIYTAVITKMALEAGVHIITNAMIASASENDENVTVVIAEKTGLTQIDAKCAIDATGDANLVTACGYDVLKSEEVQPATLQNHISGYVYNEEIEKNVKEKFTQNSFPDYITEKKILHYLKINKIDVHVPSEDADTSEGKTKAEILSLEMILKIYEFFKGIKGLENITVDFIAAETGIRESNRIDALTVINSDDYINGKFYDDSICYAFYPIDLHVMHTIEQKFFEENVVGKIPYSSLVPKKSKRIICAGRCIGSDRYANSAVRVEAVCMATGQAAGFAAYLCAKDNCTAADVDYLKLCSLLEENGAIVPKNVVSRKN